MTELQQTWTGLIWRFKWWWMVPAGVIAVLFVLLVVFADASGETPFTYQLF